MRQRSPAKVILFCYKFIEAIRLSLNAGNCQPDTRKDPVTRCVYLLNFSEILPTRLDLLHDVIPDRLSFGHPMLNRRPVMDTAI